MKAERDLLVDHRNDSFCQPVDPADFRPIAISSALVRLFHRILDKRIDSAVEFSEEQRAFRAGIDGCGDNTALLDTILRSR